MSAPNPNPIPERTTPLRTAARLLLGGALLFAGASHLTFARDDFRAQVPRTLPLPTDQVVLASGIVEMTLGASLIALARRQKIVGWIAAAFFVAIFPGNIAQYLNRDSAFGLDSDGARLIRLLLQPILVAWALWATGALGRRPHGD